MPIPPVTSSASSSNLSRYRPAILFLTGLTAAYGVYYLHSTFYAESDSPSSQSNLHRSNAVHHHRSRRRSGRRPRSIDAHALPSPTDIPNDSTDASGRGSSAYGTFRFLNGHRETVEEPLQPSQMISVERLRERHGLTNRQASNVRMVMERTSVLVFLTGATPSDLPLGSSQELVQHIRAMFTPLGFARENIDHAIRRRDRNLHFEESISPDDGLPRQPPDDTDLAETVVDGESNFSFQEGRPDDVREGTRLLKLLFHISEDQARRDGYVHRGVTCNACGSLPIRGIRYRCANCTDFDLCESCEALQTHPKSHLFYKIRIPAPFLGNPRQAQPSWYPGKPALLSRALPKPVCKKIVDETGFDIAEVDALFEQFKCLSANEIRDDPLGVGIGIDRRTFDKCFSPYHETRRMAPNLIYERIFAFYDTNSDGIIDFEEFVKGLACVQNQDRKSRIQKIFAGYDLDGDGYVDRRDFLRMFRAWYVFNKELTKDVISSMEEDMEGVNIRDVVLGSQPISSAFAGPIPRADRSRAGEGKARTDHGDLEIVDGRGVVQESSDDTVDRQTVIAAAAEREAFPSDALGRPRYLWESMLAEADQNTATRDMDQAIEDALRRSGATAGDDDASDEDAQGSRHEIATGNDWPPHWIIDADYETLDQKYDSSAPRDLTSEERTAVYLAARDRIKQADQEMREQVRRAGMNERWKRRQFYLDEEEGATAPGGFEEEGQPASNGTLPEQKETSMKPERPSSTPRSRSSSKVRFQDDVEDFDDVQSNPSTSSRRSIPIGERWGGYEIPEPERDAGKEIMYQIVQQGLNEMLDPMFKQKEDLAMEVWTTREERARWRPLWAKKAEQEGVAQDKGENRQNGHAKEPQAAATEAPTTVTDKASPDLTTLLKQSGYDVKPSSGPAPPQAPPSPASPPDPTLPQNRPSHIPSPDTSTPDPTLPQNRPNSVPPPSINRNPFRQAAIFQKPPTPASTNPNHKPIFTHPYIPTPTQPPTPQHPPPERIIQLARLDAHEAEMVARGGGHQGGKISFEEFRGFMDGERSAGEKGGNGKGGRWFEYLGAWVELMTF
ncbi:MAG: hypothetical protein M1817_000090 [Caeruleum heppii]|nr:MAG: hypothetical protein M1817_000090 [Caeruleum heppii]